jgi:hypothetical protein
MPTLYPLEQLEEKVHDLLDLIKHLKAENQRIKTDLKEGTSLEMMMDQKKRQELRTKIEALLELLKEF